MMNDLLPRATQAIELPATAGSLRNGAAARAGPQAQALYDRRVQAVGQVRPRGKSRGRRSARGATRASRGGRRGGGGAKAAEKGGSES